MFPTGVGGGLPAVGPAKALNVVFRTEHNESFDKVRNAFKEEGGDFEKFFF